MGMPKRVYGRHSTDTMDALGSQARRRADDLCAIASLMKAWNTGPIEFPKQAELLRSLNAFESFASSARKTLIAWQQEHSKFGETVDET